MYVKAVASTVVDYNALREAGYIPHRDILLDPQPEDPPEVWDAFADSLFSESDIDELHEACGRGCYLSEHRPNPATAENAPYLAHIAEVGHESVFGHGHVTFYVRGVSRALLLELERHQQHMNLNFSVMSQRYVDHGTPENGSPVHPPLFTDCLNKKLEEHAALSRVLYQTAVDDLIAQGKTRKEARGAARAFLPESTETRFYVTGSIRAWRDVIRKRATDAADVEIRLFAIEVLKELKRLAPNSVQDFIALHANELGES